MRNEWEREEFLNFIYLLMLPKIKSKSMEKLPSRPWNERFSLEMMPEYQPLKDKHTKNYRKLLMNSQISPSKSQLSPSKSQAIKPKYQIQDVGKSKYSQKKDQAMRRMEDKFKDYTEQIGKLMKGFVKQSIPDFYQYYLIESILNKKAMDFDVKSFIHNSLKEFKAKESHFHKVSAAEMARENFIKELRQLVNGLKESSIAGSSSQIKSEITKLRLLTANLIESIKRWRDYLQIDGSQAWPVFYSKHQQNILIEMLNDVNFLFKSPLANVINMGTKNDPFVLSPLKKAVGREQSLYLQIFAVSGNAGGIYQKYMQYLAMEKAHEIKTLKTDPKNKKITSIQKIYLKGYHSAIEEFPAGELQNSRLSESGMKMIELQKSRLERIKNNSQRIEKIKGVYDNRSKKKVKNNPQKDPQTERLEEKLNNMIRPKAHKQILESDEEFGGLVKKEYRQLSKNQKKKQLKKEHEKLNEEDQRLRNVKEMNEQLRNKLKLMNEETVEGKDVETSPKNKFANKNQKQIMSELKKEIVSKLQAENKAKEEARKKRKLEEEKMLENLKDEMKKQLEAKVEMKKREKMIEREELEKKLTEEEKRLQSQRMLELQMQVKLNKERELRAIEKMRREAIQKENKLKAELLEEQKLRRQQEEIAAKQKEERQKLIQQMQLKQMTGQLEEETKRLIHQSNLRQLEQQEKSEEEKKKMDENRSLLYQSRQLHSLKESSILKESRTSKKQKIEEEEEKPHKTLAEIKRQKQHELKKQIQLLKGKQQKQLLQIQKQNQLKAKMLRLKKDEQITNDRQLQLLAKNSLIEERLRNAKSNNIENDGNREEEKIKQSMKMKMIEEEEEEREHQNKLSKVKRERELEEEAYRAKIREKIEKQLRFQAIKRTKQEIEQREVKQYEKKKRVHEMEEKVLKDELSPRKMESEQKSKLISQNLFARQASEQNAKNSLRSIFQKQLFSSAAHKQLYEEKQAFKVKHTDQYLDDDYLYEKMDRRNHPKGYDIEHSPLKKSKVKEHIYDLTDDQRRIYHKQKKQNEEKVERPQKIFEDAEEEAGYQLMKVANNRKGKVDSEEEYQLRPPRNIIESDSARVVKISRQDNSKNSQEKAEIRKSKKKKEKEKKSKIIKRPPSIHLESSEVDSEDDSRKKMRKSLKKRKVMAEDSPDQESEVESNKRPKFKIPKTKIQKKNRKNVVQNDSQEQIQNRERNLSQPEKITITKRHVETDKSKFEISLDAVPEGDLDEYIDGHFNRLPVEQKETLPLDREELYRKLISQLTFSMLMINYEKRLIGMAYAFHDRDRAETRKFVLAHIGSYDTKILKEMIIAVTDYIFLKDPCDEIEFVYQFNENEPQQLNYSIEFNKWFDKLGSVYQKKLDEGVYERKYIRKRQFHHKCEIVLNGVNKNTFRNVFSINSGVVMSDVALVQVKDELVEENGLDTLTSENWISYALMIAELFRMYMTPDEAQELKKKVKQFAKLKELLIIVVLFQKRKVKVDQLKLSQFKTIIQLNMKLMSHGKEIIRYVKDSGVQHNQIFYSELNAGLNMPFNFQITSLPVQIGKQQRNVSYFRLNPLKNQKLHLVKSSLYNSEMNIFPTQNSKLKIFVLNAQEFLQIQEERQRGEEHENVDLFMYIRLFMKNVQNHNTAKWKYVWLPEMHAQRKAWPVREFRSFFKKDIYVHDGVSLSYRQFMPGGLLIQPEHRDLVITPPFIIGTFSMSLEQVTEGCPLYARVIDEDNLRTLQVDEI